MMTHCEDVYQRMSAEYKLLLAMLGSDVGKIHSLLCISIDWELFYRLAVYHQVHPTVYKRLMQLGGPAAVPGSVVSALGQVCRGSALQALNMTAETIRMVHYLEDSGIHVIVPKGATVASYLYGNVTLRPSNDIDLIVLSRDMEIAGKVLECSGYYKMQRQPTRNMTCVQVEMLGKIRPDPEHVSFWHREKKVLVELQYNLGHSHQVALPMPTGDEIRRMQVAGSRLPVLADEEWLLYLVSHGSRHSWSHLRWLVDIAKFMQRGVDWERLDLLARRFGAQSVLRQGLLLANCLLAAPLAPNYQSTIANDRRARNLSRIAAKLCLSSFGSEVPKFGMLPARHILRCVYEYLVSVGWKEKFNYVTWQFRPDENDVGFISLPRKLYPLYYVLRPFSLLYRSLKTPKDRG